MGCKKLSYYESGEGLEESVIFLGEAYEKNATASKFCSNYYPFGLQHSTSWTRISDLKNNYLYNAGNPLNEHTQNYETFYRDYDPVLGRFNQIDPVSGKYASHTPYNYAFNDPVGLNDPSGADPIQDMCDRMGIPRRGYSGFQGYAHEIQLAMDGRGGGMVNPGSGYHWADQYRSVAGNAMLMSGSTFRDFYGISNPDGSINYTRAAQVARAGGLGITFTGTFGVIELTSGSSDINAVVKGDNYIYKLDGEFYGVGGGSKGIPIQDPYSLEYTGFRYSKGLGGSGDNYDPKGFALAMLGAGLTKGQNVMFNDKTWYSLKKMKGYNQSFNGNGATGGKIKHAKKVSTGFKVAGWGLGVYNGYTINEQYRNNEITDFQMGTEQLSNGFSTFGGIYGAAWGVGWETGRAITTIPAYQGWKQETWLPWRYNNLGY